MLKTLALGAVLIVATAAFGAAPQNKDDKSTHHAAMHAEHTVHRNAIHAEKWVNHHLSAPHKGRVRKPKYNPRHSGSVHHAAMHAEHWLDHHVSAPHKPKN